VHWLNEQHIARALRIAHWYGRRVGRAEIADLEGAALEGLAKAARDFDANAPTRSGARVTRRRSFWSFAFKRIVGEMKDELRRVDHLTRDQRAVVAADADGELLVEQDDLSWINPQPPLPLDASVVAHGTNGSTSIVDLLEEPHNPIEEFELRDVFARAGAELPERERFVLIKRELEGYSNSELADAFDVTEGRTSQLRGSALEQMRRQIGDSFVDAA
jgi:RNA polymerase sigma factor (sigma-70 family)